MQHVTTDMDLQIYLGVFRGQPVRFFVDRESENIFCNLDDLELMVREKPEGVSSKDHQELKKSLLSTYHKNY